MKSKVLIFPSGAENALEINESIKHSIHVEVVPGSGRDDYSELIYENKVRKLPFIGDERFIDALNDLISKDGIDLIFPTDDTASLILAKNCESIKARIISADYYTNKVCRYKSLTYDLFRTEPFCPKIYIEAMEECQYPIFSKPDIGQGSQGTMLVSSPKEHRELLNEKDRLFLEYLPGKEYTVDCFTNRKGELLFIGPRERAQVKMGISFKTYEVQLTDEIQNIAERINKELSFRGLWFFQLKEDINGKLKLLEVSTRTAGTMGYFRHKGVNLPLFSIFDALDMDVEICKSNFEVTLFRTTINKYKYNFSYRSVYIDYDDTLIINGKINKDIITFMYQCKNNDIKLYLITKHGFDIHQSLRDYFIDPAIFDEIISLHLDDKKSNYIIDTDAIFIDNWYKERKEVAEEKGIPCFDVDIVKSLIIN